MIAAPFRGPPVAADRFPTGCQHAVFPEDPTVGPGQDRGERGLIDEAADGGPREPQDVVGR